MLSNTSLLIIVLVSALAVFLTRSGSFLLFPSGKQTPKVVLFLGDTLPCALMALLVVYCFKNLSPMTYPHGIPELIAVVTVVLLHLWKKNTLLSIIAGTVVYMLLIQVVFI